MATENILMAAVQAGGDRQDLHERIRMHALAAAERLKEGAGENDLIERLREDPAFPPLDFETVMDPSQFVGRSARQVDDFLGTRSSPSAASRDAVAAMNRRKRFVSRDRLPGKI